MVVYKAMLKIMEKNMLQYLDIIKQALEQLYYNDYELFVGHTHEQTFTFRIAHYLAQLLENSNNGLFVDCEYHRDKNNESGLKELPTNTNRKSHFRPDIIFHNRDTDNRFCIEAKINNTLTDISKMRKILLTYNTYQEGYCIYNITACGVTVWCKSYGQEETKHYVWENQHLIEDEN